MSSLPFSSWKIRENPTSIVFTLAERGSFPLHDKTQRPKISPAVLRSTFGYVIAIAIWSQDGIQRLCIDPNRTHVLPGIVESIHKTDSRRRRTGHLPRIWGIIESRINFECKSKFWSDDEYKRELAGHRRHGENYLHLHRISDASSHKYGVEFLRWCGKVYNQLLENLEIIPEFGMTRYIVNDIFEQVHTGRG